MDHFGYFGCNIVPPVSLWWWVVQGGYFGYKIGPLPKIILLIILPPPRVDFFVIIVRKMVILVINAGNYMVSQLTGNLVRVNLKQTKCLKKYQSLLNQKLCLL